MKINIVCVGKLREKYWEDAAREYTKRLGRFASITICELSEELCGDDPSEAEVEKVIEKEGQRILKKIGCNDYCIVLDLKGKRITSEAFAKKIDGIKLMGRSSISFVIGGSFGLSEECRKRADFLMCMSDMTFPHQMARVIILEQIYRAMKINANEKYHK